MTHARNRLGSEVMDTRDLIEVAAEIEADDDPDEEDREILAAIREIEESGISDWQYGETLIREDYFEEYARQLADDIGAVDSDAGWPNSYIDWEAAADALKMDYTEVSYLGTTYYVRA